MTQNLCSKENPIGTIYILGSSGFIGQNILEKFSHTYEVRGFSSIECNLRKPESIKFALKKISRNDVIIFSSGITRLHQNDFSSYQQNLEMALNLSQFLKNHFLRQLIFLSTVDVYGIVNESCLINEDTPAMPADFYAKSKLLSERILHKVCFDRRILFTNFRLNGIWGKGDFGKSTINYIVANAIEKKTITIYGKGDNLRSFIHVDDLVKIVDFAIRFGVGGSYNIAKDESITIESICLEIYQILKQDLQISDIEILRRDEVTSSRVKHLRFDSGKIKRDFNNFQFSNFKKQLKDYIVFISDGKGKNNIPVVHHSGLSSPE